MATPVRLTGFEHGTATPVTNGGGIANTVNGTPTVVSTPVNSGSYSLEINPSAATEYISWDNPASTRVVVARVYVRFTALPTGSSCRITGCAQATGGAFIGVDTSGKWYAQIGGGTAVTDSVGPSTDTWYRIDFRANSSANPNTLDWQINGTAKTQATGATAAQDMTAYRMGTTASTTATYYIDDIVLSYTSGDYPIGPGGTQLLSPGSDGTHNAGTNIIEAQDGTDIGATTAYDKLNSVPPNATTYVRQAGTGTGNYYEVNFSDISATRSSIIGAQGFLTYQSAATQSNRAGCIISKDSFSTYTEIYGNPDTPTDYSESSFFYKYAIISGAIDDTTVNALKGRGGYASDANPNPYWVDLLVEAAYATSTSSTLTAQNASQPQTAGNVTLTQAHKLTAQNATQAQTAGNVVLVQNITLTAQGATQAQTAGNVTLSRGFVLAAQNAAQAQTAEDVMLTQDYLLAVQDATQPQTAENVEVTETQGAASTYLRPSTDVTDGSWTNELGNATDLYASIDDTDISDVDYIQSEWMPSASACVVKLEAGSDPVSSSDHILSYRYGRVGGEAVNFTMQLRQGYASEGSPGTLIAEWAHTDISTDLTTANQTLTAEQTDTITDYADLYLRMVAG